MSILGAFYKTIASILTSKGDILGFSTTEARLSVGVNDTVLTAASGETLGIKWAAASGGQLEFIKSATLGSANADLEVTGLSLAQADYSEFVFFIMGSSTASLQLKMMINDSVATDAALYTREQNLTGTITDTLVENSEYIEVMSTAVNPSVNAFQIRGNLIFNSLDERWTTGIIETTSCANANWARYHYWGNSSEMFTPLTSLNFTTSSSTLIVGSTLWLFGVKKA